MKASEIREKTESELEQLMQEHRDSLMQFRMQNATGVVDNVRAARAARRDIARMKTVLNERARAQARTAPGESVES